MDTALFTIQVSPINYQGKEGGRRKSTDERQKGLLQDSLLRDSTSWFSLGSVIPPVLPAHIISKFRIVTP